VNATLRTLLTNALRDDVGSSGIEPDVYAIALDYVQSRSDADVDLQHVVAVVNDSDEPETTIETLIDYYGLINYVTR